MGLKLIFIKIFFSTVLLQAFPCLSQTNLTKPEFRLLIYGEPQLGPHTYEFVGQKWGIEFYRVAGCSVTNELVDSVEQHNKIIESLIIKKYGVDWKAKFDKDVEAEIENQKMVIALIEETDFYKKHRNELQTEDNIANYQLMPIPNSSKYKASISGWISDQGKMERVTYYNLIVDYKTKSVTIE